MFDKSKQNLRQIKSYVQRAGRVTKRQQLAIENYSEKYLIKYAESQQLNFFDIFNNNNPAILEIGFGMGKSLVQMALDNLDKNYLGVEVHKAGVGSILYEIEDKNISNLLIINHDAVEVLDNMIKNNSLAAIQIYFPDPWHKKKHNKRRLVNQSNLDLFAQKLHKNGILHFATDWFDYAEDVLNLLENNNKYTNSYSKFAPRPEWRPFTKFEKRGKNLKHIILDIIFTKI